MKTPTWAYVIGIMMMLFGGCSITGDLQSINSPNMLEMQHKMMEGMTGEADTIEMDSIGLNINNTIGNSNSGSSEQQVFKNMAKTMKEMFYVSEFTKKWMVRFGYIGLFFSILYVFAGIFLLVKKTFSIELAYLALALSILFSVIQSIVLSSDSSGGYISLTSGFSQIFGIIIDIILLVVILVSDKTAYKTE